MQQDLNSGAIPGVNQARDLYQADLVQVCTNHVCWLLNTLHTYRAGCGRAIHIVQCVLSLQTKQHLVARDIIGVIS